MKWQKKLTKKELAHVRYATNGVSTLQAFKEARTAQLKMARSSNYDGEPCYDCRHIAIKLGIES